MRKKSMGYAGRVGLSGAQEIRAPFGKHPAPQKQPAEKPEHRSPRGGKA